MAEAKKTPMEFRCPVDTVSAVLGGKYKLIIVYYLSHEKTLRFSELSRHIPQATQKMLTQQLRDLEADGIVSRVVYPVIPPKTEYSLTELGQTLGPIVENLCEWGGTYITATGSKLMNPPAEKSPDRPWAAEV